MSGRLSPPPLGRALATHPSHACGRPGRDAAGDCGTRLLPGAAGGGGGGPQPRRGRAAASAGHHAAMGQEVGGQHQAAHRHPGAGAGSQAGSQAGRRRPGQRSRAPCNCPHACPLPQACHYCPGRSYVAAGFVKWIEAAGARAVPIRCAHACRRRPAELPPPPPPACRRLPPLSSPLPPACRLALSPPPSSSIHTCSFYHSEQELHRLFKSVNGIIFPGGLTDLWMDSPCERCDAC